MKLNLGVFYDSFSVPLKTKQKIKKKNLTLGSSLFSCIQSY